MLSTQKIRLFIAAAISPVIVPMLVNLTFLFIFGSDVDKDQEIQTSISTASWVSYAITLALGLGAYILMYVKGWRSVQRYLLVGATVGLISWLLFSLISQTLVSLLFFVFSVAGLLMGAAFWFIAYFQPDGSHATSSRRRRRRSS